MLVFVVPSRSHNNCSTTHTIQSSDPAFKFSSQITDYSLLDIFEGSSSWRPPGTRSPGLQVLEVFIMNFFNNKCLVLLCCKILDCRVEYWRLSNVFMPAATPPSLTWLSLVLSMCPTYVRWHKSIFHFCPSSGRCSGKDHVCHYLLVCYDLFLVPEKSIIVKCCSNKCILSIISNIFGIRTGH